MEQQAPSFEEVAALVDTLSASDKLRLIERVTSTLRHELTDLPKPISELEWADFLKATYGILADDPIRRWPQCDLCSTGI